MKILLFSIVALIVFACSDGANDTMTANEQAVERFVKSIKNYDTVIVVNRVSYVRMGRGDLSQALRVGDSVYLYFAARTLTDSVPYETNIREYAQYYRMDTTQRSFAPLGVVLGKSDLIQGLDVGLQQGHVADTALIVFNSDLGYGGKPMGIVRPNTPLCFEVYIQRARRNN